MNSVLLAFGIFLGVLGIVGLVFLVQHVRGADQEEFEQRMRERFRGEEEGEDRW